MICPKCNAQVPPNQRFCGNCGNDLSAVQAAPAEPLDTAKTMAADEFDNYGYQPQQPEQNYAPQDNYGYQPQQPEQNYAPQDNYGYQPQQPSQSGYSYQSANNDFSDKFAQYNQPSQYSKPNGSGYAGYSMQQNGVMVQKKVNPKIIIIIVVSVLAITGIALGIVFGVSACNGGKDADGVNSSDSAAESKIKSYINAHPELKSSMESEMGGAATAKIYGRGNSLVMDVNLTVDITDEQKSMLAANTGEIQSQLQQRLPQMRSEIGVDDLVVVLIYRDISGNEIARVTAS